MKTIFNMVLLLLYTTSIISLVSSTINGVKRNNAKALWNCAGGFVFLICAGVWHWFYFKSGHAFVGLFAESVDEIMFDITFTILDIGMPMIVTRIIRFLLVTIPYWIEITLAFLALKGGDSATACMLEVEEAEKVKQASLRAERYAKNRTRAVVSVTEDATPVCSDLSSDNISRLRIKAKRNELTEDERMIYSEYLRQQQAEGKWNPEENAYKNSKRKKPEFDWCGVFRKIRKAVIVLVVVGIALRFGSSAISNLVNKTFTPGSDVWQSSPLEPMDDFSGSHGDLSDEDEQKSEYMSYRFQGGRWSFDEWIKFLDEVRGCEDEAGLMRLSEELKASGFNVSGGWDFGSFVRAIKNPDGGGRQTIEDLGSGTILINE